MYLSLINTFTIIINISIIFFFLSLQNIFLDLTVVECGEINSGVKYRNILKSISILIWTVIFGGRLYLRNLFKNPEFSVSQSIKFPTVFYNWQSFWVLFKINQCCNNWLPIIKIGQAGTAIRNFRRLDVYSFQCRQPHYGLTKFKEKIPLFTINM